MRRNWEIEICELTPELLDEGKRSEGEGGGRKIKTNEKEKREIEIDNRTHCKCCLLFLN